MTTYKINHDCPCGYSWIKVRDDMVASDECHVCRKMVPPGIYAEVQIIELTDAGGKEFIFTEPAWTVGDGTYCYKNGWLIDSCVGSLEYRGTVSYKVAVAHFVAHAIEKKHPIFMKALRVIAMRNKSKYDELIDIYYRYIKETNRTKLL